MLLHKRTFILLFLALGLVWLAGCGGKKEASGDSRVVAKINKYELMVSDLKLEGEPALGRPYLSNDPAKAKREILEYLIDKQVLVQEALSRNFDKQKAFMLEIEKYWEQALIKMLLNKKMADLAGMASPEAKEAALRDWIRNLRERASVNINEDILNSVDLKKPAAGEGR